MKNHISISSSSLKLLLRSGGSLSCRLLPVLELAFCALWGCIGGPLLFQRNLIKLLCASLLQLGGRGKGGLGGPRGGASCPQRRIQSRDLCLRLGLDCNGLILSLARCLELPPELALWLSAR